MLALQLEIRADVRVAIDEVHEGRSLDAQRDDVAARAHRGRLRQAVEQRHLPEAVAGAKDVEWNLVVVVGVLDHASATGYQDVQRVGRVAFRGEDAAERKRRRHEMAYDQGA